MLDPTDTKKTRSFYRSYTSTVHVEPHKNLLACRRSCGILNAMKRPIAVIIVAVLYLIVGVGGFIGHFPGLVAGHRDAIAIEVTELLAAVCGVFLLLRHNWARWLAVAWIAFHVAISFTDPIGKLAVHVVFCILIAWALFRPATSQWFQPTAPA